MPKGVYIRKPFSREHRQKMSDARRGVSSWNKGKIHSEETKQKMSIAHKDSKYSNEAKQNMRFAAKGRKKPKSFSKEHRCNLGKASKGRIPWMKGRKHSEETKRKMRISAIQRIERDRLNGNQLFPRFNSIACQLIDEYGYKHGYNFQHAMNGGEFRIDRLGYFVDGYDAEKNVVIEVDESHHHYKKARDKKRQDEIVNLLGCKFIRLTLE